MNSNADPLDSLDDAQAAAAFRCTACRCSPGRCSPTWAAPARQASASTVSRPVAAASSASS